MATGTSRDPIPPRQRLPKATGGLWVVQLAALAVFAAATGTAIAAQQYGRPITAAIVYLVGVTVVGALGGIRGGLAAAVIASLIYNFFISDPVFVFSLSSAEDYVPLLAFNAAAAASALLAGRLRDKAVAAERANASMSALLDVSRNLQVAVDVNQIPQAISHFVEATGWGGAEIFVAKGDEVVPLQEARFGSALARKLLLKGSAIAEEERCRGYLLTTGGDAIGALVLIAAQDAGSRREEQELTAFLNLLSIALERCLLLERVSDAELVRRSEEFKTALLSSVSHDMRTPLAAISASASSLASYGPDLPEDVRGDLLATIAEQCGRLNRYTTNLLNLGRLQAGVDPRLFTECDALDVLGTAIARTRQLATGREICKVYALDAATVRADPVMLEQVFYNVLENAARYSPSDSFIKVTAGVEDRQLRIDILSGGEGIPPDDLNRVFERFYRSRSAASQNGSGLGLSIAKGFTEAFGGSIRAQRSEESGSGTTITIMFPLHDADAIA